MMEAKPQRPLTIHEEFETRPERDDPLRFGESGHYYVVNFVLSDMHGAYMPIVQSGPWLSYAVAWREGLSANVRTRDGHTPPRLDEVIAARAFSVMNLTEGEVTRLREREEWLMEPMMVPQRDEGGHVSMRLMERPFA